MCYNIYIKKGMIYVLRADVEKFMSKNNMTSIVLVLNDTDKLGIRCELKAGYLCDFNGHRVDRKKDIWGYMEWNNGESSRIKFQ